MNKPKIALVYDRVNKWGGAERVLLFLHKMFPDAPLYTSVYNPATAPWAKVFHVKTSFLQSFPSAPSSHEFYAPLMPIAFESFNFDEYDIVLSVTSEAAKGIITKPTTKHICYCLTPTRYLWSGHEEYFRNPFFKFISIPVVKYLRNWEKIAATRPDNLVSISSEVKTRVRKYYSRDSEIIYPPVEISNKDQRSKFKVQRSKLKDQKSINNKQSAIKTDSNYFLVVSRLIPYKRIDIAIRACNELRLPLKIVGTGSEIKQLRSIAGDTIEFLGHVSDSTLKDLYSNSKALIFPGFEDFGLVMAEAQSFGKPVIAFRGGGALDIIQEGKTGEFFNKQTPESLIKVLEKFKSSRYNSLLCRRNSDRFSYDRFKKGLEKILASL